MNTLIKNLVNDMFYFLDCCLGKVTVEKIVIPKGLELKGVTDYEITTLQKKIKNWSEGSKYLEFKFTAHVGLYIRLNKSCFNFNSKHLILNSPGACSFYHRKRNPGRQHPKTTLICHYLSKGLDDIIMQHINAIPINIRLENKSGSTYLAAQATIPTLREFLPVYEGIMYLENPNTADTRVKLIQKQFTPLLDIPLNYIRGAELIGFMNSFKKKRSAVEIQEEASRFTVAESTMKGYICVIRGLIQRASNYSHHPFKVCESIYCDALKFQINDDSDKYLTEKEIINLINNLSKRDQENVKQPKGCHFTDYLTPLILLLLATGLRPKYALKLKWAHLDFNNEQLIIKGGYGKIKSDKIAGLTNDAVLVLKEWKKHIVHQTSKKNWVFPSPKNPEKHLTTYKTAFTTFKTKYNLEEFVMYDMRHTFATHYTAAYKNIHTTQDALHHACPKSVKRYARHLESDRKEGMMAFAKAIPSFSPVL